jgi:hypothetical protein
MRGGRVSALQKKAEAAAAAAGRRHPDIPQEGLFPAPEPTRPGTRRAVKMQGRGVCPACGGNGNALIGQVRGPRGELIWREHVQTTRSGARLRCRESGQEIA